MNKKRTVNISLTFGIIALLILVAFHPALNPAFDYIFNSDNVEFNIFSQTASASQLSDENYYSSNKDFFDINVSELIDATIDPTDTDTDGLPDSVEYVIGTDYNNSDSDFDNIADYDEIFIYKTDPMNPDSNDDGLADYFEVTNVSLDIDNDGTPNAWDSDNDNDGVDDSIDLAPFTKTIIESNFHLDVETNGKPTYMNFQLRPNDPNNLKLAVGTWDWPDGDDKGLMKDLNNSKDDVYILPYLELEIPAEFKIISKQNGKCLEVKNSSLDENENIIQNSFNNNDNQIWNIIAIGEGYYKIIAKHSGMCLGVDNISNFDFSPAWQSHFIGADNQLWKLENIGNNTYRLISKYNDKCLDVGITSTNESSIVCLSNCEGKDTQLFYLEPIGNTIPDQSELTTYGIFNTLNKTYVPLFPNYNEYGRIEALSGKMFYPESSDLLHLNADVKLQWVVNGNSDNKLYGLQVYNGKYVTVNESSGNILGKGNEIGDLETLEWIDLGQDMVSLKANNGKYVTVDYDNNYRLVSNKTEIGEWETFKVVDVGNNQIALKANNDKYVCAEGGGGRELVANRDIVSVWEKFNKIDLGYISNSVNLVKYYEDFMFTGLTIQENYGSNVSVIYSDNINKTISSGFVLSYEFLRSQNHISEIPTILESNNINVNTTIALDLNHQDETLFKLTGQMIPEALLHLHNLTKNETPPIIFAVEDCFTTVSMDELYPGILKIGNDFSIDLRPKPVITSKSLKMNWYNISSLQILDKKDIIIEVRDWGYEKGLTESDNALADIIGVMIIWNTGESVVTKIGNNEITFDHIESSEVLDIIQTDIFLPISGLIDITIAIQKNIKTIYRCLAYVAKIVIKILNSLKALKISENITKAIRGLSSAVKALNAAKATKFIHLLDRISKYLILVDIVITGVIAFYIFWSILFNEGFSRFGALVGTWAVIFTFVYAAIMIGIAYALPIVGLILAILDAIFGWFEDLLGWFLDLVTKSEMRNDIDIDLKSPSLVTHDYDDNGLDVGDRIEFSSILLGRITRTSYSGRIDDLTNAYVHPLLTLSVNQDFKWDKTCKLTNSYTDNIWYSYRDEYYDSHVWVEPRSMVNFPMTIQLQYSYKIFYDKCVWFFGWWCDRESKSETKTTDITTLYFDVMPGNISAFVDWTEINSIDPDGDGLTNSEEFTYKTNPYRFDTDGDGLYDKLELDDGILPYNSDTDGDGLNDGLEYHFLSDANNSDSDGDGLSDYEEYRGWPIEFDYFGKKFRMNVTSNPLYDDSDDDGLSDLEEYMKKLNPKSKDTNGDGIGDCEEYIYPSQGLISNVDFNGYGNYLRIEPGHEISVDIDYRVMGINCTATGNLSNCSIVVYISNFSLYNSSFKHKIYHGTPKEKQITTNTTNFYLNASNYEGLYYMKYYINWSCAGILPQEEEQEIIGIIDVNKSGSGNLQWTCFSPGKDTDNDGIINVNEIIGWPVTYKDIDGEHIITVNSDPNMADTDSDGLTDLWEHNCYDHSTNPRNPDTDGDGLIDSDEILKGTDPLNYDTDGDGLDDNTELNFKSNPFIIDTDSDNLTDEIEFLLKSNPNKKDTDYDGLSDYQEYLFNSSPLIPDTDNDNLFDKEEYNLSTNPNDPDTDGDGLIDGYEVIINTDPKNPDTDQDGLNDNDELYWSTNPLLNDTDSDKLNDGDELFYGTHPLLPDSDFDGLNDSEDPDSFAPHVNNIIFAYDLTDDVLEFKNNIQLYTNVTVVSAEELLTNSDYRNSSYIVLVGRPDAGNGTVGNITKNILIDTGDNYSKMINSDYNRFAVKYGVWNKTQTIVMLSKSYPLDHWIVLNILKTMRKTVLPDYIQVDFPTPRKSFTVETISEIDTLLWVELNKEVIPSIKLFKQPSMSIPLEYAYGLGANEYPLKKFIGFNVSENIQNKTENILRYAWIIIYYTKSDLDRTGDKDSDDVDDIDEKTLKLYCFDEKSGQWIKLSDELDWVNETGVDTHNVEFYGKQYEGYVWAKVTHFSIYGIGGNIYYKSGGGGNNNVIPITNKPPKADASASDNFGFVGTSLMFDGSLSSDDGSIVSYLWDFGDGSTGSGEKISHIYNIVGTYSVKLTVTDDYGSDDSYNFVVTISNPNLPPEKPIISGPQIGNKNNSYSYTFISSDPDGDKIKYYIDWGDEENITSPYHDSDIEIVYNHSWSKPGIYKLTAASEDEYQAISEQKIFMVFIDVTIQYIKDIIDGYFIDENNDGTFDIFLDNITSDESIIQKQPNGLYYIDKDGDGLWDYIYNPETQSISVFQPEQINHLIFILIILIILIVIILAGLIYNNKNRKKLKNKNSKKIKEENNKKIDIKQKKKKSNKKK